MLTEIKIRPIELIDNAGIAYAIRTTLEEFGANKPGTVYFDESTNQLFELFQAPRSIYHIALLNGKVVGGGGIYPTPGLPSDTCELVKMYVLKKVRGIGLGRLLIQKSLDYAREEGYNKVYLETMPALKQALSAYQKFGFEYINQPMGESGHFGCDLWMLKEL